MAADSARFFDSLIVRANSRPSHQTQGRSPPVFDQLSPVIGATAHYVNPHTQLREGSVI